VNIYLVMEEANGGELLDVIQKHKAAGWCMSERWSATVMDQVFGAISYCHRRRLMHKDLKAENIMLLNATDSKTQPHAVVIDLGLAEMFETRNAENTSGQCSMRGYDEVTSKQVGGTPTTMAPEVWQACIGGPPFGLKCDVYSLGVVLFQLLTGELPFMATSINPRDWLAQIEAGPPMRLLVNCSHEAKDLIACLLTVESRRPTARDALKHSWFQKARHIEASLTLDQITALSEFANKNEFQKAVIVQVASQVKAVDLAGINATFASFDTDRSGKLNRNVLVKVLVDSGLSKEAALRAAKAVDLDKNGTIEYTEFVTACISMHDDHLDMYLWQIFRRIDKDNSGKLDYSEVQKLLTTGPLEQYSSKLSGLEISNMVEDMDKNKNGFITFDDFRRYCNPSVPTSPTRPRVVTR